jgi:hypothetical protein
MVAALIMARGYKASGFQGQVKICPARRHDAAGRDGEMPHRVTARCRTDVIGMQRNFP